MKCGTLPPLLRIKASLYYFCRSRLAPLYFLETSNLPPLSEISKYSTGSPSQLKLCLKQWTPPAAALCHLQGGAYAHCCPATCGNKSLWCHGLLEVAGDIRVCCRSFYLWMKSIHNAISVQEHNWLRKTQMHFISNCALVLKLHYQCTLQKSSATGWSLPHCNETIFRPEMLCPTMEPSASQRCSSVCWYSSHWGSQPA